MNKAALPVITVLTALGHVTYGRGKYVRISSKIQIELSSNLGSNKLKFTSSLTSLQNEGILKGEWWEKFSTYHRSVGYNYLINEMCINNRTFKTWGYTRQKTHCVLITKTNYLGK